jgi:hypothetical protein
MRAWIAFGFAGLTCIAVAQSPIDQSFDMSRPGYTLALPTHPGRLHLDAPTFDIVEASAKPSGSEFGLRGQDKAAAVNLLVFLFRYPEEAPLTSEKCRDAIMQHVQQDEPSTTIESKSALSTKNPPIAVAQYSQKRSSGDSSSVRAFIAKADLCADIEFTSKHPLSPDVPAIKQALNSVTFDPDAKPSFREVFWHATVLFDHKAMKAAAPFYEQALSLLPPGEPTNKWRRVATDQAVMAYGISGDLEKSRAVAEHAIQTDPDYPLNYYNLACADAEAGNATQAKLHLQQAFDRKANVIPGESLPDPTQDDSIQKLQGDKSFWDFVQKLQKSRGCELGINYRTVAGCPT